MVKRLYLIFIFLTKSVEIVNKLEIILNQERKKKYEHDLKPMSVNEFNEMNHEF